jgi:SAM-dependent methyltransferase
MVIRPLFKITVMNSDKCRLCGFSGFTLVCQDKRRAFYICGNCELISVPKRYWLSVDDERKRYELHDNSISNAGYVKFLSQIAGEIQKFSGNNTKVLDFGSGREAALCQLLSKKNIYCRAYDPLFDRPLQDSVSRFDIIVLCEVIEHLRAIKSELEFINKHLANGGKVILRTQVYGGLSEFSGWWYGKDVTHINFFNEKSLRTAAGLLNKNLKKTDYPDIFLLE